MKSKTPIWRQLLVFSLVFTGCGQPAAKVQQPLAPKKTTLIISCPEGIPGRILETQGKVLAQKLGMELKILLRAPASQFQHDETPDLWVFPARQLGDLAQKQLLAPLASSLAEPGDPITWQDFLPLFREKLCLWNQKILALPLAGESTVCFFREDLLTNPRHKAEYKKAFGKDLKAPATWEEFANLAQHFASIPDFQGQSLGALPSSDEELADQFLTVSAGYTRPPVAPGDNVNQVTETAIFSFLYDFRTGKPAITNPGFIKGLEWMKRTHALRSKTQHDAFLQGKALFQIGPPSLAKKFQETKDLRDNVGICLIPASEGYYEISTDRFRSLGTGNRIPLLGLRSHLMGINPKSSNASEANRFLVEIAGPEFSERIALESWVGGYTRYSQMDRIRLDSLDLDVTRTTNLREAIRQNLTHPEIRNPAVCLRIPGQGAHMAILGGEIRKFLASGKTSSKEALQKVALEWIKLDSSIPEAEFQSLVRQAAGLLKD